MDASEFLRSLSPELRERARACKSADEILALAKEEKVALPDDVLAAVAGGTGQQANGCFDSGVLCPKCGTDMEEVAFDRGQGLATFQCTKCGELVQRKA